MTVAEIKDYIDEYIKDLTKQELQKRIYTQTDAKILVGNIKSMLDQLDERPKAKWVATERHLYMCTNCESEFIETSEHNYCPYCGARMENEEDKVYRLMTGEEL